MWFHELEAMQIKSHTELTGNTGNKEIMQHKIYNYLKII